MFLSYMHFMDIQDPVTATIYFSCI